LSRLGQRRVIQTSRARSLPRSRRRGGARLKAMLSWWRRNRFSASSRRGDLKKSMTNIVSECRSANIVRDHAMILPDEATPKPDGIFGKDTGQISAPVCPARVFPELRRGPNLVDGKHYSR